MTTETKRDSLQRPKGRGFSHASIMKINWKLEGIRMAASLMVGTASGLLVGYALPEPAPVIIAFCVTFTASMLIGIYWVNPSYKREAQAEEQAIKMN